MRAPIWRMSAYSRDVLHLARLHHLGDDRQARPLARLGEEAEPLEPEPLEGVGAGPRLEGAAAQDVRADRLDRLRGLEELVARLDGAGPGGQGQRPVPDRDVADPDDRVLGVELARGELEGPAGPGDRRDAGQDGEPLGQALDPGPALAEDGHDHARPAAVLVGRQALLEDGAAHRVQLLLGRPDRHHHEHLASPRIPAARAAPGTLPGSRPSSSAVQTKKQRSRGLCSHPARPPPESRSGAGHAGLGK